MMVRRNSFTKIIVFLLVTLMTILLAAHTARAAEVLELPDPEHGGSITVHKFAADYESNMQGDGTRLDDNTAGLLGTPLENVGFTLYMIDEGYKLQSNTTAAEAKANAVKVGNEIFTNEYGIAYFGDLSSARYYVLEESTPPLGSYRIMEPVIISVPYSAASNGDGWNYDVHVYPKNIDTEEVTKTVINEQDVYFIGDTVSWSIGAYVNPEIRTGEASSYSYGYYRFIDVLDERLTYTDDTVSVTSTLPDNTSSSLNIGDDYTAAYDAGTGTLTITFTEEGIDTLLDSGAVRIEIGFNTVINEKAFGSESVSGGKDQTTIENDVKKEWKNAETNEEKDAKPSVKPEIKLAYLEIIKVDSENTAVRLNGARFKLAASLENANDEIYEKDNSGNDVIAETGADTRSGETAGYAIFTGLPKSLDGDRTYYLVEVRTPDAPTEYPDAEYVLKKTAIPVTLGEGADHARIEIENIRLGPTFELPLTGGMGSTLLTIIGLFLIFGSGTSLLVNRVKRKGRKRKER